jgi:hypothetical protein
VPEPSGHIEVILMRSIALLLCLASLPFPAGALAQSAPGRCPAEPATAVAVAAAAPAWSGAGMARPDLAQNAVTVMLQEIERVGLTPVAALQASATSYLPTQTAGPQAAGPCVPMVTLAVATTAPRMIALYVSRYTEQVTVTASVTLPDGRLWQRTRADTAAWYSGYVPIPFSIGGYFIGGLPIATSQAAGEQAATARAVAALADSIVRILRGAPAPTGPTG